MSQTDYERQQADFKKMIDDYEEADHAEFAEFMSDEGED